MKASIVTVHYSLEQCSSGTDPKLEELIIYKEMQIASKFL